MSRLGLHALLGVALLTFMACGAMLVTGFMPGTVHSRAMQHGVDFGLAAGLCAGCLLGVLARAP